MLGPDRYHVRRYKLPKIVKAAAELVLLFKKFFWCPLVQVLKAVFFDEAKAFFS